MKNRFRRNLCKSLTLIMIFTSVNFSPFITQAEPETEAVSEASTESNADTETVDTETDNTETVDDDSKDDVKDDVKDTETTESTEKSEEKSEDIKDTESTESIEVITDEPEALNDSFDELKTPYDELYSSDSDTMLLSTPLTLTTTASSDSIGSMSLDWTSGSENNLTYKGYSSSDGGKTWKTISLMDYTSVKTVKVLQVYPIDGAKNQLKTWMETSGYGKGIIKVDSVSLSEFNSNTNAWMKNSDGTWKYDVVFFGTWDANGGNGSNYDLSVTSVKVVEDYIKDGRGCIVGHDTISTNIGHNNFASLAHYFDIDVPANFNYQISSKVKIEKKGLFTTYPWNIGDVGTILTIPAAHVYQQYAKGDIWLSFVGVNNVGCNNFYLTTYNNCAMIQTGHSSGAATDDEQKILANLIFYCYQITTGTTATDNAANDTAAPNKPTVTINNDIASLSATDNGTQYQHKIEAYKKSDLATPYKTSNTTTTTVTTGVKGYRYLVDNSESTKLTYSTGTYTDKSRINAYGSNKNRYLHIVAVDGAGNVSETTTVTLKPWTLKATANSDDIGSVSLDWTDGSTPTMQYKGYSSSDGGKTWKTVSLMDYTSVKTVKVLQVYPHTAASNQLKTWMETNGYGKGIIKVDSVYWDDYNANPYGYLKDSAGNWKYDVIFFGTWDANNGKNLSNTGVSATKAFIETGRGCIMGHDTIGYVWGYDGLGALRDYFGIKIGRWGSYPSAGTDYNAQWGYLSSQVVITKKGLFTTYPWNIGDVGTVLNIPAAHTTSNSTNGDVWLDFTNGSYWCGQQPAALANAGYDDKFYLSTKNNCAMIQTGHSSGAATDDEQKIIANLIFYCYQVTFGTTATDNAANDQAAPNKPTVTVNNGIASLSATDNGTQYQHKIEAYDKSDLTNPCETSNVTTTTVTTGVKGYRYLADNSESTKLTYSTGTYTDKSSINAYGSNKNRYLHIAAVDGAGNVSETVTITLKPWTLKATANSDGIGSVSLDWTDGSTPTMQYKGYSSSDGGKTWKTISLMDYTSVKTVKVLQVYPIDAAKNQLKTWMETNGYGKGIIKVDDVLITDFNNNPNSYLKDSSGNWKYDVIFFGTWDSNAGNFINETAYNSTKEFIESGRGCIMGHDTLYPSDERKWMYALAPYFGLQVKDNFSSTSTQLKIAKKGLFTTYPWYIGEVGDILTAPASHSYQTATKASTWIVYDGQEDKAPYLLTYNNCAMINTGHSNGAATDDEQKILANLIFYCYQVTFGTTATDNAANDITAPNAPTVETGSLKMTFSATDNGTTYLHKIESYDKSDLSNAVDTTNTTTSTVTTGVKKYYYLIDSSKNTKVTASNSTATTDGSAPYTSKDVGKYFHVAAVDGTGNVSKTTSVKITGYVITYDANGGTGAPGLQYKAKGDTITLSSTKPTRTGYTFKGWATSKTATTVNYASGASYKTDADLSLYAVWSRNSYRFDVNELIGGTSYVWGRDGFTFSVDITDPLDSSNNTKFDVSNVQDFCNQIPYGCTYKVTANDATGYTLDKREFTGTIGADATQVIITYTPRRDIKYVVNHYIMNVNGVGYSLKESKTYNNGVSDTQINVDDFASTYAGFTYDGGVGGTASSATKPTAYTKKATVYRDGTLVINLFYTRNKYTVTVKLNGGSYNNSTADKQYTLYYEQLQDIAAPVRDKCKFIGWVLSDASKGSSIYGNGTIGSANSIFQMGYSDVTITAGWSVLPVFTDVNYSDSFFEGQDVTVDMLKLLIMVSDADKLSLNIDAADITIDRVAYKNTTVEKPNPSTWKLDVSTNQIGDISVTYSVKDVLPDMSEVADPKDDITTVTHIKQIHLLYDDFPRMTLNPTVYTYTNDSTLTKSTIASFLKSYIAMSDAQDDTDNVPWWKLDASQKALKESVEITKVSDININPAYEIDNPAMANTIKSYTSVEQIYALKSSNVKAFNAIMNYKVTFDAHDQWGKYCSGKLSDDAVKKGVKRSGKDKIQSETDRTITVVCVDSSSFNSTYEAVRDVNNKYRSTLDTNSFWGDENYGGKTLDSILKKKNGSFADYNTSYIDNNGNKLSISIKDFTK